jgi:hypothetical protein
MRISLSNLILSPSKENNTDRKKKDSDDTEFLHPLLGKKNRDTSTRVSSLFTDVYEEEGAQRNIPVMEDVYVPSSSSRSEREGH